METIGDAYMVSAGIPEEQEHHASQIAMTALEMREVCLIKMSLISCDMLKIVSTPAAYNWES